MLLRSQITRELLSWTIWRWELYFLHSLNHWLSKINCQSVGDWPFYVWRKQGSSAFGNNHIQMQLSVSGSSGLCLLRPESWTNTVPWEKQGRSFEHCGYIAVPKAPSYHQPKLVYLQRYTSTSSVPTNPDIYNTLFLPFEFTQLNSHF